METTFPEAVSCQNDGLCRYSRPVFVPLVHLRRAWWMLRTQGFLGLLRGFHNFATARSPLFSRLFPKAAQRTPQSAAGASLNLVAGEWVEVKSQDEIRNLVDSGWCTQGLQFVPEMREYYGRRLRVLKRVEKICVENSEGNIQGVRSMKNTVLLEGAMCKGGGFGCDRSCHYFWREAWLKRVDPTSP